ncbi:MAG: NADH:ubiquinone reductase (Na(+)-transporting) subunit A [Deferribacterales bacterium]
MMEFKNGLKLPLPKNIDTDLTEIRTESFGIVTGDFVSLKPTIVINEGEKIRKGDILFTDKYNRGLKFISNVDGYVKKIYRGEKRRLIAYHYEGESGPYHMKPNFSLNRLDKNNRSLLMDDLINSGLWISFRERPFDRVANPDHLPDKIFVILRDTRPYAPNYNKIIVDNLNYLLAGIKVGSCLTDGEVLIFKDNNLYVDIDLPNVKIIDISGSYPSSLVGTLINQFYPLNRNRRIWYIDYQDVIMIGKLYLDEVVDRKKIISYGYEKEQKLYLACEFSSIKGYFDEIIYNEDVRIIAGTPIYGRRVDDETMFLNRYINTVSVLKEVKERSFMGWLMPGLSRYSVKNVFISKIYPNKITFNTSLNGSYRPMLPIGSYEKVSMLNTPITYLLRSIITGDLEMAEKLGVLDFGEEDMAVFTFVSVGKIDYTVYLRKILDEIESEI